MIKYESSGILFNAVTNDNPYQIYLIIITKVILKLLA